MLRQYAALPYNYIHFPLWTPFSNKRFILVVIFSGGNQFLKAERQSAWNSWMSIVVHSDFLEGPFNTSCSQRVVFLVFLYTKIVRILLNSSSMPVCFLNTRLPCGIPTAVQFQDILAHRTGDSSGWRLNVKAAQREGPWEQLHALFAERTGTGPGHYDCKEMQRVSNCKKCTMSGSSGSQRY